MKVELTAELFLTYDAIVGEGPYVDFASNTLTWVDMLRGTLHRTDLETGADSFREIAPFVGAVVPADDDAFAVALLDGFGLIRNDVLESTQKVLEPADLRFNDAKADARGRLWAGSTQIDFATGRGSLYRWDGVEARRMVHGFTLPNGLGWSPDGERMYVVDSIPGRIHAGEFDIQRGEIGPLDVIAEIDEGLPDGMAVDEEGCLWVAIWGGGVVNRYSPRGELIGRVRVPVSQPSSCAFGPRGTLWITSARSGLSDDVLAGQPLAGSVFVVDVGLAGAPVHRFRAAS